jgi:patatin-related protein
MDDNPGAGSLIPPGGTLELYVTATDLEGYEILVPAGTGGATQRDRSHAQVLQFFSEHQPTRPHPAIGGGFDEAGTAALAFAGRATACFPGAFRPVSITTFNTELGGRLDHDVLNGIGSVFRYQHPVTGLTTQRGGMNDAELVDGGLLDNTPFDLVTDAISGKRAEREVARRLVYIEPAPDRALDQKASPNPDLPEPGYLEAVLKAVFSIRGTHSVLRDLFGLRDLNARIAEIGDIARLQEQDVRETLDEVLNQVTDQDGTKDQVEWTTKQTAFLEISKRMHEQSQARLGAGFLSYSRLKLLASATRLADEIAINGVQPPDSTQSSFVSATLSTWVRSQTYWAGQPPEALADALQLVDLPYRERRLRFLLQGVNDLYQHRGEDAPPRQDLNNLKREAWRLLDQLRSVPSQVVRDMAEETRFLAVDRIDPIVLDNPQDFTDLHTDEFRQLFDSYGKRLKEALGDGGSTLWQVYAQCTDGWDTSHTPAGHPSPRQQLLVRYLGFPMWDGIIFPTIALSRIPQFTPITIAQFSPLAARALIPPQRSTDSAEQPNGDPAGTARKLLGTQFHHFGGFFDRNWRINDYLWGRLDGAELLLRTLQETAHEDHTSDTPPKTQADAITAAGTFCNQTLTTILTAEPALTDTSYWHQVLQQIDPHAPTAAAQQ